MLESLSCKKTKLTEKMHYFRQELHHLKREAPSMKEIRIGNFLKEKYARFF